MRGFPTAAFGNLTAAHLSPMAGARKAMRTARVVDRIGGDTGTLESWGLKITLQS